MRLCIHFIEGRCWRSVPVIAQFGGCTPLCVPVPLPISSECFLSDGFSSGGGIDAQSGESTGHSSNSPVTVAGGRRLGRRCLVPIVSTATTAPISLSAPSATEDCEEAER